MPETTYRLCAVGDLYLADSPFRYGHGVRSRLERHGTVSMRDAIRRVCDGCDGAFANLECVMSDEGRNVFDLATVEIRGTPKHLKLIRDSGFGVVNVANNHIFQHGTAAFHDTVERLEAAGIGVVGADEDGRSRLHFVEHSGLLIGFAGFSLHHEQYRPGETAPYSLREDHDGLIAEMRAVRAKFEGPLVCSLHWGYEYLTDVSRGQQRLGRALIDEGVDVVLGHHPHTVQAVERYRKGLIAYSLGNFVFDLAEPVALESAALHLELNRNGLAGHRFVPLRIGDDYVPRPATGRRETDLVDRLEREARDLEAGRAEADDVLAEREKRFYAARRRRTYAYFLKHFWRYNPYYFCQSLARALFRRLGLVHNP